MKAHLYLVTADKCPDDTPEDAVLLVGAGFEDHPEDTIIPFEQTRVMTTVLVKADNPAAALKDFSGWWEENVGGQVHLELLTDDETAIQKGRLKPMETLENNQWSFRASYIAYKRGSEETYKEAKNIVVEAELENRH